MNNSKNRNHIEKREKGFCVHFNNANSDLPFNIRKGDTTKKNRSSNALRRLGSENQPENIPKYEENIEKPEIAEAKPKRERKGWDIPRANPFKEERSDSDAVEIGNKEKSKSPLKERKEGERDSFNENSEPVKKEKGEFKEDSEDVAKNYGSNQEVKPVNSSFKSLDIRKLRQKMKEEKLKKFGQEPELSNDSPKLLKDMEEKLNKVIKSSEPFKDSPKTSLPKVSPNSSIAKESPKSSITKDSPKSSIAKESPKSAQKAEDERSRKSIQSSEYSSASPKSLRKSEDRDEKSLSNEIEEEIREEIPEEIDENAVEPEKEIIKVINKTKPACPVAKSIPRRVVRPLTANAKPGYTSSSFRPVEPVYSGIPSKQNEKKKERQNVIQISKQDLKQKNNYVKPLSKPKIMEEKPVKAGGNLIKRIQSLDGETKQMLETILDKIETGNLEQNDLLYLE